MSKVILGSGYCAKCKKGIGDCSCVADSMKGMIIPEDGGWYCSGCKDFVGILDIHYDMTCKKCDTLRVSVDGNKI